MFPRISAVGMIIALSAMQAAGQSSPLKFAIWQKHCNEPPARDCVTMNTAYSTNGTIVAQVQLIDPDGTGPKVLRALLSADAVQVGAPVTIATDDASPIPLKIQACVAARKYCYADLPMNVAVIDSLKTGKTVRIEIVQQVSFPFPLEGYRAAVDSKGMTPTEYRQDMERRAEEALKRLEEQARPRR